MFHPIALPPPVPMSEMRNVPPSKRRNVFRNAKPSKNLWRELLVHKQYGAFKDGNEEWNINNHTLNEKSSSSDIGSTTVNSNIIQFEDDLYTSKEVTHPSPAIVSFKDTTTPYTTHTLT